MLSVSYVTVLNKTASPVESYSFMAIHARSQSNFTSVSIDQNRRDNPCRVVFASFLGHFRSKSFKGPFRKCWYTIEFIRLHERMQMLSTPKTYEPDLTRLRSTNIPQAGMLSRVRIRHIEFTAFRTPMDPQEFLSDRKINGRSVIELQPALSTHGSSPR